MHTYKTRFTYISIMILSFCAFTAVECGAEDLTTLKGKTYEDVKITKVNSDSVSIDHKSGMARISFLELSAEFLESHPELKSKTDEFKVAEMKRETQEKLLAAETKKAEAEEFKRKVEEKAKADADDLKRREENKELLSNLFSPPAEKQKTPRNIKTSVVLFEGSNGSGSGFKVMFGKLPVIVTNAHVFFGIKDVKIRDIDNNASEVERILASKTRDLVILKYKETSENSSNLLYATPSVSNLPLGLNVEAYGNSLGDGVITILKGDLLGIGPDKIEIDAPIVSGNSGGPVVCTGTKEVIGVSTYLHFIKSDVETKGSRFAGSKFSIAVRRFATRIDNLAPEDIQIMTYDEVIEDQNKLVPIEKLKGNISRLIEQRKFQELVGYCRLNGDVLVQMGTMQLKSAYLQKQLAEWREYINYVFKNCNMDPDTAILRSKLTDVFSKNNFSRKTITVQKDPKTCPACGGRGKSEQNNRFSSIGTNSKKLDRGPEGGTTTCRTCNGAGTIKDTDNKIDKFQIPNEIEAEIAGLIVADPVPFYDLPIGGEMTQDKISAISGGKTAQTPNPFGNTIKYKGNKSIPSAVSTELCFMFGRLVRVKIDMDCSYAEYTALLTEISKRTADNYKLEVSAARGTRNDSNAAVYHLSLICRHDAYPVLEEFTK